MTRKKQGGRKGARGEPVVANGNADEDDREDEEVSGVSGQLDRVEEAIDQMLESRTSTREKAMQEVKKGLQLHYAADLVEKWQTTLSEGIMRGFKKGRETEFRLAAQLLDVIVLTLGAESEDLYTEFAPVLSVMIKDTTASEAVRGTAVTSFALLTFVGCSDQVGIRENIRVLEEVISNTQSPLLFPPLLRGWGLLLTNMPVNYIETEALANYGEKLVSLLDLDEFDARLAAGEVLALIFDTLQESSEANEEQFDMADYEGYLDIDGLIERLKELAAASGHHISKKEKAKLKTSFKEILHSIESGSVPQETLTVANTRIDFDSWERLVQLNFVRHTLAEGTLVHFENNELLQQIFDYSTAAKGQKVQYSKLEKRLYLSSNSQAAKEQTLAIRRSRQHFGRTSKANFFIAED